LIKEKTLGDGRPRSGETRGDCTGRQELKNVRGEYVKRGGERGRGWCKTEVRPSS